MAGNSFQIFGLVLLLSMHAQGMLQLPSRLDISVRSPGVKTLFCFVFLLNKAFACCSTEILVSAPWSIILVAAFSVDHVCPFKYRTCHSEREQNSDLQLAWRKIRTRKQNALRNHEIAQKQSLYNDLFTDSRKKTFRMWKTAKKWLFIS